MSVALTAQAIDYGECQLQVTPGTVTFGAISATTTLPIELSNLGNTTCLVSNLALDSATTAGFSLPNGEIASVEIPAHSALDVPVRLASSGTQPYVKQYSGAVLFEVTSHAQPDRSVPLTGAEGCLQLTASPLDEGPVPLTCHGSRSVYALNNCNAAVTLLANAFSVSSGGGPDGGASPFSVSTTFPPGGALIDDNPLELPIAFAPKVSGEAGGTATLVVSQATGGLLPVNLVYRIPLGGEGVEELARTDHFTQAKPKVDVLVTSFDVAQLPSGGAAEVAAEFANTLAVASDAGVDFQLALVDQNLLQTGGVITGGTFGQPLGDAAGTPYFLTAQSTDFTTPFSSVVHDASTFTGTPMPYQAFSQALGTPATTVAPFTQLLRPDAALALVVVQARLEQSGFALDPNVAVFPPDTYYLQRFLAIKGGRRDQLTVNVASELSDTSCFFPGTTSRYTDLIAATGGATAELCQADWAAGFEPSKAAMFALRSRFELSGQPDPATVTVAVNGSARAAVDSTGNPIWTYEPTQNWVRFELNAVPAVGASIDIGYDLACP